MTVAAVVVTYKRSELLKSCIDAILAQKRPVNAIYIIDNGKEEVVHDIAEDYRCNDKNITIKYLPMDKNVGGSGGFYFGLKKAYEDGFKWFWIMDDDTCAEPEALANIFEIIDTNKFGLKVFASAVYWKDGAIHTMNYPSVRWKPYDFFNRMIQERLVPIRHASFVSLVISAESIEKYGFPIHDYFIWNEDAEYTARILKNENGCLVLDSKVFHLTKFKDHQVYEANPERFFYEVRNKMWMIFFSDAWFLNEKIKLFGILGINIYKFFRYNKASLWKKGMVICKGLLNGFFVRPKK